MQQRRRVRQTGLLEDRLDALAKRLYAKSLPSGAARNELIQKARQAEIGSHMSDRARTATAKTDLTCDRVRPVSR
jgi:hypothetical protein